MPGRLPVVGVPNNEISEVSCLTLLSFLREKDAVEAETPPDASYDVVRDIITKSPIKSLPHIKVFLV